MFELDIIHQENVAFFISHTNLIFRIQLRELVELFICYIFLIAPDRREWSLMWRIHIELIQELEIRIMSAIYSMHEVELSLVVVDRRSVDPSTYPVIPIELVVNLLSF